MTADSNGLTVSPARDHTGAVRACAIAGAFFGGTGVAAGAFGAHGLKGLLAPDELAVFETAVRYQTLHALALFAAAGVGVRWPGPIAAAGGACFAVGIMLFSGSLYLLSLTGARSFGLITPAGGVVLLAGWLLLGIAAWRGR